MATKEKKNKKNRKTKDHMLTGKIENNGIRIIISFTNLG